MNMLDRLISLRRRRRRGKSNSISSVGGCEEHKSERMKKKKERERNDMPAYRSHAEHLLVRPHVQCNDRHVCINSELFLSHRHPICLAMSFVPCSCSTPKFVPVLHQPSHFVLAAPIRMKTDPQRPSSTTTSCRPLRQCQRYHSKQSNASTAINRQSYFATDSRQATQIFFCLPWNLLHRSKRRRHRPCQV